MNEIMDDQASDIQKAAYLTALSLKGETIDEITASAKGMREHCVKLLNDQDVLEIVGTGGDGLLVVVLKLLSMEIVQQVQKVAQQIV